MVLSICDQECSIYKRDGKSSGTPEVAEKPLFSSAFAHVFIGAQDGIRRWLPRGEELLPASSARTA
jgi:hypothetical protein